MIDTVRCRLSGEWKERRAGWVEEIRQGMTTGEDGGERERDMRWMSHEETGLRLMGDSEGPTVMELSLPRQIYPHNGFLLPTMDAITEAWGRCLGRIDRVAEVRPGKLTRLDLVWQYRGNPMAWVQALGSTRHPKVRKEPCQWFGQSVTWQGKETVLRAYDKALEVLGAPGDVVRLESQLRGKALEKAVGAVDVEHLAFGQCWKAYRECWSCLPAFTVWEQKRSWAGFLAFLASRGIRVDGQPVQDLYTQGLSVRQQRRVRSAISRALVQEVHRIDLAEVLPMEHPPEVVNLAIA